MGRQIYDLCYREFYKLTDNLQTVPPFEVCDELWTDTVSKTRLISIVSNPIKVVVVLVVIVVVFVQKVRSKTFFVKKNLGQDIFNPKKFRSKNILGPKNFGLKECGRKHSRYKKFIKKVKILGRKFLVIKTFRSKKLCPKIYLTTKIKTPNQNKCHHDRWHLLKTVPGTYLVWSKSGH